jgi:hypothetical protein
MHFRIDRFFYFSGRARNARSYAIGTDIAVEMLV